MSSHEIKEVDEFQESAIEPLKRAYDLLQEAAQYLRECPGHEIEYALVEQGMGEVEKALQELDGEDYPA